MGLRDQLGKLLTLNGIGKVEERFNLGQYPAFLQDYYSQMGYSGSLYPLNQTALSWSKTEEISATLPGYMTAVRKSPPAFAAQLVRASVMSQARLVWRNRADRHVFRNADLRVLEKPWPNGTQGELLGRMEWSAGLTGNAYVLRQPNRLRVLRSDWVKIVYGSQSEPDDPKGAIDAEVVGYAYKNGGWGQTNKNDMTVILPGELAHWTPLPDPMSPGLGMSWITPALRELQADQAAEEYKIGFFTNGATPNLVVKAGDPKYTTAQFQEWVDKMESTHKGAINAFKTLYLTSGADATVIGSNLAELDLTSITSHSETRISYLSRVPAVILGIAAGLKGSSLNAGNYGEARRNFADSWYYSTLQDACASLAAIVTVPGGAELWYDVADVPLLREDAKDAADIEQVKATTINSYVTAGFTPESAILAVGGQNITLLVHSGLVSVQLIPPMPDGPPKAATPTPDMPMDKAPAKQASEPVRFENHNHFPEGFVQMTLSEGAIDARSEHHNEIDARTTVEATTVNVAPAEVSVPVEIDARTTIEEGAVQAPVDARTTIAEGAVQTATTIEKGAVDARTTIAAGAVRSEHTITLPAAKPKTKEIRVKRADGTEATATIQESE